jgi:hypothetical protein
MMPPKSIEKYLNETWPDLWKDRTLRERIAIPIENETI